jgi:hypothetical protein
MKNRRMPLLALLSVALVFSLILPVSAVGASASLPLVEDFEDGQDQGWSHSGAGLINVEGDASIGGVNNKVYNLIGLYGGTSYSEAITFYDASSDWGDYQAEFDIRLLELDAEVLFNFRFLDWNNYYDLAIRTGSGSWGYGGRFQFSQHVGGVWSSWWIGAPVEVGTWYHIKVSAIGDRIRLYFNDELKFDQAGFTLEKGKIGFWTCSWPGEYPPTSYGHVHIDNIRVGPPMLSVPYCDQGGTDWCLPHSMSMVFEYYGRHIHSWDIAKEWGWDRKYGDDSWDLVEWDEMRTPNAAEGYFQDYGLSATSVYYPRLIGGNPITFDFIKTWIDTGSPVLLSLQAYNHTVVVVGYDSTSRTIFVNDPSGALVEGFVPPEEYQSPFIGVGIPWDGIDIQRGSWAVAVSGVPYPTCGMLDIGDYSVRFKHALAGPQMVWDYMWGEDDGLVWEHSGNHAVLDASDRLIVYGYLVNHTSNEQSYCLEVSCGSIITPKCVNITNVADRSSLITTDWDVPLRGWLTKKGEYALSLTLWDQSHTRVYDEVTLPPITYDPSLEAECVATATGTGTAWFTPSNGYVAGLTAVPTPSSPPVELPHGMFSFRVTGLSGGQEVTLTIELPEPAPVGTRWWKYQSGLWYSLPVGDDNGDRVITVTFRDGVFPGDSDKTEDGVITDPGGPGYPGAVGWETYPINKTHVLLPWIALFAAIAAGVSLLVLRRRAAGG